MFFLVLIIQTTIMACINCEQELLFLSEKVKLEVSNGCLRFDTLSPFDQYLVDNALGEMVNFFYELDPKKKDTKYIYCSLVNQYSRNYYYVMKHLDDIGRLLELRNEDEILEIECATIYKLLGSLLHGIFPNHFCRFATLKADIKKEISKLRLTEKYI